jgi:hypothetical protein
MSQGSIIITSIFAPTEGVRRVVEYCPNWEVIVVGDRKTPADWHYEGVRYMSLDAQYELVPDFARACPLNHYARKNVGYLAAIRAHAPMIAETDDDNIPYPSFLQDTSRTVTGSLSTERGWDNVYRYFTSERIWARGLPLDVIVPSLREPATPGDSVSVDCPIQQFLADGDPDVDAIYRLTVEGDIKFEKNTVILQSGTFSPFNSQNTLWFPEVYPLLYLPSYVSFRMTDIWRSFVAQACLYALGGSLAFREATVYQVRNAHNLMRDFNDEIPGYVNNRKIMDTLNGLSLSGGVDQVGHNLHRCYEALLEIGIIESREMPLVEAWLREL